MRAYLDTPLTSTQSFGRASDGLDSLLGKKYAQLMIWRRQRPKAHGHSRGGMPARLCDSHGQDWTEGSFQCVGERQAPANIHEVVATAQDYTGRLKVIKRWEIYGSTSAGEINVMICMCRCSIASSRRARPAADGRTFSVTALLYGMKRRVAYRGAGLVVGRSSCTTGDTRRLFEGFEAIRSGAGAVRWASRARSSPNSRRGDDDAVALAGC